VATTTMSYGIKAARDTKEARPTNRRRVMCSRSWPAAPSPSISPLTSLPTWFPYQLVLPTPPATSGMASATVPSPAKGSVAVHPPQRRRLLCGPRRVWPASRVQVRRAFMPVGCSTKCQHGEKVRVVVRLPNRVTIAIRDKNQTQSQLNRAIYLG